MGITSEAEKRNCEYFRKNLFHGTAAMPDYCMASRTQRFEAISGGFGGFNRSLELTSLPPDSLKNEFISFSVYV
jgi:hypothetical protein